jgi:hypothetical protein
MCGDREFCLFVEVHTTSDGVDPDRIVPQEGGRGEDLFESCANTFDHIFYGELERGDPQSAGSL